MASEKERNAAPLPLRDSIVLVAPLRTAREGRGEEERANALALRLRLREGGAGGPSCLQQLFDPIY